MPGCPGISVKRHPSIYALSDVHVDYAENLAWLEALPLTEFKRDTLVLAGDVSGNFGRLENALRVLRARFENVIFVPGNHDLWLDKEAAGDSLQKFHRILDLCHSLNISTQPLKLEGPEAGAAVWIVPLFSWYVKPHDGEDSLFITKPTEKRSAALWADDVCSSWRRFPSSRAVADHFLGLNERHLSCPFDAPVISVSHFLPRTDLLFPLPEEVERSGVNAEDPNPQFNFSRVAGCAGLDRQIRRLGSFVHIYGHQHRNRDRVIDGVRYVSHCLGYPKERAEKRLAYLQARPKLIWHSHAHMATETSNTSAQA